MWEINQVLISVLFNLHLLFFPSLSQGNPDSLEPVEAINALTEVIKKLVKRVIVVEHALKSVKDSVSQMENSPGPSSKKIPLVIRVSL